MPRQDGTGPQGLGPRTGRQMGNCPGAVPTGGFGRGQGMGRGRGFGRGFRQPVYNDVELTKEQEAKILEAEKAEMEAEITEINKKLKEITK